MPSIMAILVDPLNWVYSDVDEKKEKDIALRRRDWNCRLEMS